MFDIFIYDSYQLIRNIIQNKSYNKSAIKMMQLIIQLVKGACSDRQPISIFF